MAPYRRGYSLLGILLGVACMVVLFAISMSAMNKRITGGGATTEGTVNSLKDQLNLRAIHQTLVVYAGDLDGRLLTPSLLVGSEDRSLDTTANFYSAMIMEYRVKPEQLISANEQSQNVWVDDDYDYFVYDSAAGVRWDPAFAADLDTLSNVSFAHMPMFGRRHERAWRAHADSGLPLIGNRGPRDGVDDLASWTYGRDGTWAGQMLYPDGHVEFVDSFTPPGLVLERNGEAVPDNLFAIDDGPEGEDAIISFTREMTETGPVLQFD
jgi:hypothetical protein